MKKETVKTFKDLAFYSSLGFSIALSIFIGLGIGLAIDSYFGSSPIGTIIFLLLGIAAGFRNIALAVKKSQKL